MPRVALATCSNYPDLHPDEHALVAELRAAGVTAEPAVWDAPRDWSRDDLVVVRSTWDYVPRRDAFLAWAESLPRVLNPPSVLRWSTDKRYLAELAAAGVAVVPTTWVEPGAAYTPPEVEHVVKPVISAGSKDSARYGAGDPASARHVAALGAAGRAVMVQPYIASVDDEGETALLYFAGRYSHAAGKGPILRRGAGLVDGLYAPEELSARIATPEARALGERALDAVPGGRAQLLYARVDVVRGPDGAPLVLELELAEPSLFLEYAPGATRRFRDTILDALASESARRQGVR